MERPAEAWIIFALLTGAMGFVCFYFTREWLRALSEARTAENVPTMRIRSAAQGYVELQGFARPLETGHLTSPLTSTQCVWWVHRIVLLANQNRPAAEETRFSPQRFYLEDATGRCLIDPAGAEMPLSWSKSWDADNPGPPGPASALRIPRYRCTEGVLRSGTRLYVRGEFRTVRVAAQPLDIMRGKLAAWQADDKKRAIFDVDRDGSLSDTELEAARRVAMLEARREAGTSHATVDVVCKPADGRPFVISDKRQPVHARSSRGSAMLNLACAVITAASLAGLIGSVLL